MFVYTVTKKRALRILLLALAVIAGIVIGIAAILTAISTGASERKTPIYGVERGDNKISLTFDCAWGNSNTDELLAALKKENIRATFFVTGEFCDKYAEDVLKIFKAGHEIGNHSDKHPHIEGLNINELIHDTKECARKIRMITNNEPALYRAPYGEYDNNAVFTVEGMGYKYIQWSVDSVDWQEPDAATIIKRVTGNTKSGSILLFHNDLANTAEALPDVIAKLKKQGFEFVPVSELVYNDNYTVDSQGMQIPDLTANNADIIHAGGAAVNEAIEIISLHFTAEEIAALKDGINEETLMKIAALLNTEQLNAIRGLSEEELASAWDALMTAKQTELERLDEDGFAEYDYPKDGYLEGGEEDTEDLEDFGKLERIEEVVK